MSERGIDTRQNIINKSLQLFSEKGYYNTPINDILAATHASKGCIYNHFRTKQDIWYAAYDDAIKLWRNIE
jgi:TetR/AcrR family transcriptional repressor of nem operon